MNIFREKHPNAPEEKVSEMVLELNTTILEKIDGDITFVTPTFKPFLIVLKGNECIGRLWAADKFKKLYEESQGKNG